MNRDHDQTMVTASGDVLLTQFGRWLASPVFVTSDPYCDRLLQLASPCRRDPHRRAAPAEWENTGAPL